MHFTVTDFKHDVPVSYTGVLPDLFREGTGVVAHGHMNNDGTFVAEEVLAKHDEKYMPPEVAKSLKRRHGEAREEVSPGSAAQAQPSTNAQSQSPSTTNTLAPSAGGTQQPSTETVSSSRLPASTTTGQSATVSALATVAAGHSTCSPSSATSPSFSRCCSQGCRLFFGIAGSYAGPRSVG